MKRNVVRTAQAPAAIGPYSQAIRLGNLLFTAGQIALDPATGRKIWEFDPDLDLLHGYSEATSRGVSAWHDSRVKRGSVCALRIFIGTIDARLIAVDGATGKPNTRQLF